MDNLLFSLHITADVNYDDEEDIFYISYPELNILVWDKDRKAADSAFQFALLSLIQNFYNEDDSNLTNKAKEIKWRLSGLIEKIK